MKKILLAVGLFVSVGVFAQKEVLKLSLNEAIDYAVKNNYDNKIASKNIDAAKKRKWETTTMGLPQVNGKVDYKNWIKQRVTVFPASFADPFSQLRLLDNFYNLSSLKLTDLPPAPTEGVAFPVGAKQSIDASVTVSQLIFDGSYLVGLQSAKTYLKISEQAKMKTALATREAIVNAYGNVLVTEKTLEILKNNQKILTKNLNDIQKIYENGLTELENVEQLQITLGTLDNNIRNIERMKKISRQLLNISLGNKMDRVLELTDSLESLTINNTDLGLLAKTFNLDNHIDYKIAKNSRESKRLLMKLEQSKALPNLAVFLNYGVTGNAQTEKFTFFDSDQKWFDSTLFGVTLNVPIFSSLGRAAKTARARIDLENADIQLQEIKQKLNLQVESAKSEYQLSIENLATAKKNLSLAEKIEKKHQIKFFEGLSSSFDLSQAQNQLYTQQNNYIQAMLNVIAKKTKLETALNIPLKN